MLVVLAAFCVPSASEQTTFIGAGSAFLDQALLVNRWQVWERRLQNRRSQAIQRSVATFLTRRSLGVSRESKQSAQNNRRTCNSASIWIAAVRGFD